MVPKNISYWAELHFSSFGYIKDPFFGGESVALASEFRIERKSE